MQQTAKYKFNLIETSDTFSPEALNANTQAVETQLATLEKTADTNKSAADAAIKALNADVKPGSPGQMVRMATGTYVGKGSQGAQGNPPNTLTFNFKPMLIFVCSTYDRYTNIMMRPGTYTNAGYYGPSSVTWGETSVTWTSGDFMTQCNMNGITYYYVAIGVPV